MRGRACPFLLRLGRCLTLVVCFRKATLEEALSRASPLAVDLVRRLLVFNAEKRASADEALAHQYLAAYNHDREKQSQSWEVPSLLSEWLTITVRLPHAPLRPAPRALAHCTSRIALPRHSAPWHGLSHLRCHVRAAH